MVTNSITLRPRRGGNVLVVPSSQVITGRIGTVTASFVSGQGSLVALTSGAALPGTMLVDQSISNVTVQQKDASGNDTVTAGSILASEVVVGSTSHTITYTNNPATVNSTGLANFGTIVIRGLQDNSVRIKFEYNTFFVVNPFTPALWNFDLNPGLITPSTSVATVPAGTVNQVTTFTVQPKDISGNDTVINGASTVCTAVVSGANSANVTLSWGSTHVYTGTYTPTHSGTDHIAITLAGSTISGSPYNSAVAGASGITATSMRIGIWDISDRIGQGPGGTSGVKYRSLVDFSTSPHDVCGSGGFIDQAETANCLMILVPSGNRSNYLTGPLGSSTAAFSRTLYQQQVERYLTAAESSTGHGILSTAESLKFKTAVNEKRILLCLGDEFNHRNFNGTANPADLNWAGNLHKQIWRNGTVSPLTCVRMSSTTLVPGWNGIARINNWPGLDFGWAQRSGQHNGQTFTAYFTDEQTSCGASGVNCGVIPAFNLWNGGIFVTGEGNTPACWDVDSDLTTAGAIHSGYIVGANNTASAPSDFAGGTRLACNALGRVNRVIASPAWLKKWAEVISGMGWDCPIAPIWTSSLGTSSAGGLGSDASWARPLESRADFVAALQNCITTGLSASGTGVGFTGWRTSKHGVDVI